MVKIDDADLSDGQAVEIDELPLGTLFKVTESQESSVGQDGA